MNDLDKAIEEAGQPAVLVLDWEREIEDKTSLSQPDGTLRSSLIHALNLLPFFLF